LKSRSRLEGDEVSFDEIALTLPPDQAFNGVAHLVLGGLAVRLDLTVEMLEDLELALDALLERKGASDGETTVRVRVGKNDVRTIVGPFRETDLRDELERETVDALGLRRILDTVADGVVITDGIDAQWVELTKRLGRARGEAA
jgi:hypothetical protein